MYNKKDIKRGVKELGLHFQNIKDSDVNELLKYLDQKFIVAQREVKENDILQEVWLIFYEGAMVPKCITRRVSFDTFKSLDAFCNFMLDLQILVKDQQHLDKRIANGDIERQTAALAADYD